MTQSGFQFLSSLESQFERFHRDNPEVYSELVRMARTLRDRGETRWSMDALFHVLRWNRKMQTRTDDFRLNDHYTAFYARLIMERETDLAGFFETRKRKAA